MAAIASAALLVKFYDWMRLFKRTAFYVQLLTTTFKKIQWFMLLLATAILVIGLPMSMLSLGRDDESELMVQDRFGWWLVDAIYN